MVSQTPWSVHRPLFFHLHWQSYPGYLAICIQPMVHYAQLHTGRGETVREEINTSWRRRRTCLTLNAFFLPFPIAPTILNRPLSCKVSNTKASAKEFANATLSSRPRIWICIVWNIDWWDDQPTESIGYLSFSLALSDLPAWHYSMMDDLSD